MSDRLPIMVCGAVCSVAMACGGGGAAGAGGEPKTGERPHEVSRVPNVAPTTSASASRSASEMPSDAYPTNGQTGSWSSADQAAARELREAEDHFAVTSACPTSYIECNVPMLRWPALGGKVVGLLVDHDATWGPVVDRSTSYMKGVYTFYTNGSSSYTPYFAAKPGEPITLTAHRLPTPKGSFVADVSMLGPSTVPAIPPRWGLGKSAHLVELEVNGGEGGTQGFAVTGLRVLDGSKEFPLVAESTLRARRSEYEAALKKGRPAIEQELAKTRKAAPKGVTNETPEATATVAHVTWLPNRKRLVVFFATTVKKTWLRTVSGGPYFFGEAPARSPRGEGNVMGHPMPPPIIQQLEGYGVETGGWYESDASGTVVASTILPPRVVQVGMGQGRYP